MGDLIAELRHMQCEPASFDVESVASAAERAADALAAKDREIARLREALIAVMNCPDIRVYIGSQVSRIADDALAPKESGNE